MKKAGTKMSELIPGYYLWRDRIPFFITLLYLHYKLNQNKYNKKLMELTSTSLMITIPTLSILSIIVWKNDGSLEKLVGFHWNIVSPLSWGLFICICYYLMWRNGNNPIDSFFYSFLAGVGGGWLYDTHHWIINGNYQNILKLNYFKILFIDYQVICIPLLVLLILFDKEYSDNKLSIPLLIFTLIFYQNTPHIKPIIKTHLSYLLQLNSYAYIVRLPVQLYLINVFREIKPQGINNYTMLIKYENNKVLK